MEKARLALIFATLVAFLTSLALFPSLPENMASHWDMAGNVNGYMPKLVGAFLMPVIIAFIGAVLLYVPRVDPLKKNYTEKFKKKYANFTILLTLFMLLLHFQILFWNMGFRISISQTLPLGTGVLIYYAGVLCQHAEKRNWFVGLRTPWSMSNDIVWKKTNQRGGKALKTAGLISILGVLAGDYAILFTIIPIFAAVIYSVWYSYSEYSKLPKRSK